MSGAILARFFLPFFAGPKPRPSPRFGPVARSFGPAFFVRVGKLSLAGWPPERATYYYPASESLPYAPLVYIIKVKGKAKIPDYIQLRDENFVLIAYFRADRPLKDLHRYGLEGQEVPLAAVISELEFGKLRKLEL